VSRVVVVGSGGREHALAWAMAKTASVVVTPGNDGMRAAGLECTSTSPVDLDADLFVIGPDLALVAGLADTLRGQGKTVFGPNADGAKLEGSKAYMKELLEVANVPTAAYGSFTDVHEAHAMLRTMTPPYVIKTDGLAAGKGVLVTHSLHEAEADVRDKLAGQSFGDAGHTVVIEEGLVGEECSLFVVCDGTRAVALPPSQDFKRLGTGDVGPNTGGMGAFAPLSSMSLSLVDDVMRNFIEPTLRELRRRGIEYRGVFYAGLMLTTNGPKLLEYNVRFGDPETQVLMPLIADDVAQLLMDAALGNMVTAPRIYEGASVTVILAAEGYPVRPRTGAAIDGLGNDGQLATPAEGVVVFHAGTKRSSDGQFTVAGGRVVAVTATANCVTAARERAYAAASTITFAGRQMRTDVARGRE
jgi:phosphoribosylamine---glycine ligase